MKTLTENDPKISVTKLAENFKMSTESGGNDFWVSKKWWGGIDKEISLSFRWTEETKSGLY